MNESPNGERRPTWQMDDARTPAKKSVGSLPGRTASRRKAHRALDREPWKKARGEREAPHPVFVEFERHRVICRECPWFWVRVGATYLELREMGKRHRANMREAGA